MDRDGLANFFLGLGIGVGLGILFAPKSGEETRDLLMNKADDGKEYLKKQTSAWKDQASDIAGDLVDKGSNLVDKGKEAINRQKDNLADAVEAGKQAYREKVDPNMPSEARS